MKDFLFSSWVSLLFRIITFFVVFMVIAVYPLTAEECSGVILDSVTNSPIPDCHIQNDQGMAVTSDITGRFNISFPEFDLPGSLKPKAEILIVSHPNYHSSQITISEPFQPLIIRLEPVIYPLKPVNIEKDIHSYEEIGFHSGSFKLNSVQIESSNSTAEAINQLPGIIIKSYGGPAGISTVSLLGGQADRIAILLDGIMLNNEQNGSADISQIPHSLLENMSFYPQGTSASLGSSAMTGAINLKPRSGKVLYSHNSGSYHQSEDMIQLSHEYPRMSWSASAGRLGYDGRYIWNEGGIRYDYFTNEISQLFYYIHNKLTLPDSIQIKAQLLNVNNSRQLSGYLYSGPDLADMNDRLQIISAEIIKTPFKVQWNQKLNIIDYENPPVPAPPVSAHHRLKTSNFTFRMTHHNSAYRFILRNENSKSTNSIDTSRVILSSILERIYTISKFELISIFRIEFEKHHQGIFAGEGTLVFHANTWWKQSSLTLSNNYKRPGFNDLFWIPFGNPELKIERSINLSLRNKFNIFQSSLEMNIFYIKYEDLIQWTPTNTGVVWSPENIPAAESTGYNLFWEYNSNPLFRISISLLRNDTHFHSSLNNELNSKSLRYSPKYIFSIDHSTYFHGFILVTGVKSVSKQIYFYDHPKDRMLPGYRLINVALSKKIQTKYVYFVFTFTIHNLTNIRYQTIHGYPEPGRSFSFKSTITLN